MLSTIYMFFFAIALGSVLYYIDEKIWHFPSLRIKGFNLIPWLIAGLLAVFYYVSPSVGAWLNLIFLIFSINLMVMLVMIFFHNGSFGDLGCFGLGFAFLWAVGAMFASRAAVLFGGVSWFARVPLIAAVVGFLACVGDAIVYFFGGKGIARFLASIGVIAIAIALSFATLRPAVASVNAMGNSTKAVEKVDRKSVQNSVEADTWYHFYNSELQTNSDKKDDFNFGPNPYVEGKDAKYYDGIFRETLRKDPAIGAADIAWLDANVGTRYLGEFYESCKEDWAKTINQAKVTWMKDESTYNKTLEAFFKYIDRAEVSMEYRDSGLDDQMYMNPDTVDGVPDVVVFDTLDHEGWFLVYTFEIKGASTTTGSDGKPKDIAVAYRIDCRFQPTNVEKVMKITPQENPITPSNPTSTPTSKPTPSEPTPSEPTPSYNKDKTQGTQGEVVQPNDNPGPGPSTNNGAGAQYSTEDKPTNSNHMTDTQYQQTIQNLENNPGQAGGTPNTPTVTTPANTNVDNNGDSGNGNGGIDEPTPQSDLSTTDQGEIQYQTEGVLGEPED